MQFVFSRNEDKRKNVPFLPDGSRFVASLARGSIREERHIPALVLSQNTSIAGLSYPMFCAITPTSLCGT